MDTVSWILDRCFGGRIAAATRAHLNAVARAPLEASRARSTTLLRVLSARPGRHVTLGVTDWGALVRVPLADFVESHGLVTGGSGSGKTMTTLLIIDAMLESSEAFPSGFAVVDGAKSDLFLGALVLLKRKLEELSKQDPRAAAKLRRRVRIIDFAASEVVTAFNILARWPDSDPEAFAAHQTDLLLDLVPDGDALKLASAFLKTLVQIFSAPEIGLSVVDLMEALDDDAVLESVLDRSRDAALVGTLRRQMATVLKSTRAALRRRLEVLVSSKTVARMLRGRTAPDWRRFQDDGCYVFVNAAGPNISGSLARLLNTVAVSSLCRAIPARRRPELPFLLVADEAHTLLRSSIMREHLSDAGRLARRYGTYVCLITQDLSAAISDPHLLRLLHTNAGWSWSGRGDPADCAFLRPILPVTGRRPQPKRDPFEETRFYTAMEERSIVWEEIANLPNRTGWLWLKGQSGEAIKMRTQDLDIPQGRELEEATLAIRRDPTVGQRISRKEYERLLAKGGGEHPDEGPASMDAALERAYERTRGTTPKKAGE